MHIQCELVGRVGKVPEETVVGMVRFSVAVDTKKGQEPIWVSVVCFSKTAEIASKWVTEPGQIVFVTGKPEARGWLVKDGTAKAGLNVVASTVKILTFGKKERALPEDPKTKERVLGYLGDHETTFVSPDSSYLPF